MTDHARHIASADLTPADIPNDDAPFDVLNTFAHSFDAYAHWGFEECARIANERDHVSLDKLRTCLFFEARRGRFQARFVPLSETPEQARMRVLDEVADEAEFLSYWRELVGKIREDVVRRANS